jgi:hypothetical protein
MKTITRILFVFAIAVFTSCEGPVGPPGPPGEGGQDGDSFLGSVFEIEGDFTSDNDYSLFFEFPNSIEVFESDVVLVYILWEQTEDDNGQPVDVWRLLPQTVMLDEGVLQYNYDHTFNDVQVFLEGTIDFNTLLPAEWQNQVFRIAVLPADYAKNNNIDVTDFSGVMKSMKINPNSIQKLDLNTLQKDIIEQ